MRLFQFPRSRNLAYCSLLVIAFLAVNAGCSKINFTASSLSSLTAAQSASTGSLLINQGAPYTNSKSVTLTLASEGANFMLITNDPSCVTGGTWQPFATSAPWTLGQTDQTAQVFVQYRTASQALSGCISAGIIEDDIAPLVIVDTPAPAMTSNNDVTIRFHATDALSGLNQLLCILPGKAALVPCDGVYTGTALADGNYLVQLAASDNAGNTSALTNQKFMVDTTAPVLTLNSEPSKLTALTTASFTFTATDNLSGVAGYYCRLDQAASEFACSSGQQFAGLSQGTHSFSVFAVDQAGNKSAEASYAWIIDGSVPTIQFTQTPSSLANTIVAMFGFTGQDDRGNSLISYECRLNGAPFTPCSSPELLTGVVEGENTFGVRGIDIAGVYSSELDYTWLVDLTPPVIKLLTTPSPLTNSNSAQFIFTATDDRGSGIISVTCSIDKGTPQNCASMNESYSQLSGNAQHSFQVTATDAAGNAAMSAPYTWYIDNTPPVLTIISKPPLLSPTAQAQFQILATDQFGPVTYNCGLESSAVLTPCDTAINYANLTNGSHQFFAQAQDAAGNLSALASYTWKVETIGPVITFTETPGSTLADTTQGVLSYTINDPISTVVMATCTLDITNITPCSTANSTLTFPLLADGTHTFKLSAANAAGYNSTKNYTFTVVTTHTVTYPSIGSVAAVAWEDLYGNGSPDSDYNDFLMEFQVTEKVDSSNQITDIYLDFYPRAVGAGYDHSVVLALTGEVTTPAINNATLPRTAPLFHGAANIDITYYDGGGNVLSKQASAPYNNQDVMVFSSTHGAFGLSAGSSITNTAIPTNYIWGSGTPSNYIAATQNARIHLALNNPADNPVPSTGQIDLSTLRMVLHVKDTNENVDIINVDPNNFAASNGFPWGFIIPTDWQWMQESVNISRGYPNFAAYANFLQGKNPSCATTDKCINWFNYPATDLAAQATLYPSVPFKAILPAP